MENIGFQSQHDVFYKQYVSHQFWFESEPVQRCSVYFECNILSFMVRKFNFATGLGPMVRTSMNSTVGLDRTGAKFKEYTDDLLAEKYETYLRRIVNKFRTRYYC